MPFTKDKINYILVTIISLIVVLDLFLHSGQSATFDGPSHITAIADFGKALKDGDFPVSWVDGYANYGSPIALLAHQVTNYLGAVMSFYIHNYILVYNLLMLIGVLLSGLFFYRFLRIYFEPLIALLGTVIFTFAPYKILNIYIRGALPELFSGIFLPLILIALHRFVQKKNLSSILSLVLFFTLLVLTHPFMFEVYMFIIISYFIFLIAENDSLKESISRIRRVDRQLVGIFLGTIFLALLIASYYVIPLLVETKYLVYSRDSQVKSQLAQNQYLSWDNFLNPNWYYFYKTDIFQRAHQVKTGIIEFASVFIGAVYMIYQWVRNKKISIGLFEYAVLVGLVLLFFTTYYSDFIYQHVKPLAAIQFPWRMLSAFIFIPPIIIAYLLKGVKSSFLIVAFMVIFSLQYVPQLYGKNYTNHSAADYLFTPYNLFGDAKNTLWTAKPEEYPIKKQKYDIIGGKGSVRSATVHNSWRKYVVDVKLPLRMVDYTFYFPGWNVYIDGKPTKIEFQDINYRGVITYFVPTGHHEVLVKFEDTKVRLISKIISIVSIIFLPVGLYLIKRKKLLQ